MSFGAWVRRQLDKLRGHYYEGPEPPERIKQAATAFAAMNPHATVGEWVDFATGQGEEFYRSGYVRGLERRDRAGDRAELKATPELAAAADERHDWSWVDMAPAEEAAARMVRDNADLIESLSPEERLHYMDRLGEMSGGFRVDLLPVRSDPKAR